MIRVMNLNVYVMPLVPYLAGKLEPTLMDADEAQHAGGSQQQAKDRVKAIQDSMSQALGLEVRWPDEGGVAFTGTVERGMLHALRALVAWHEYPDQAAFALPEDPRDHPSLKQIYQGEKTGYPHLMRHSDNRGFWFPVDYPAPARCCEASWWLIGSTRGLGRELDAITPLIEALSPGDDRDYLAQAHALFARAVSKANEHELPVIIEGA